MVGGLWSREKRLESILLHSKIATGTIEATYFTSRTSSKHFNAPSKEARKHLGRLREDDER